MKKPPKNPAEDTRLGMRSTISRRDFLDGVACSVALAAVGSPAAARASTAPQDVAGYYPPALTGIRGNHPGSFEAAHALRDGAPEPQPTDTGETYDLIVVGAGISGLSAAHFYRAQTSPRRRILMLDNHDDFGGHAKRNEFMQAGRLQLMNGGTLLIDSPRPYGPVAAGLLQTLGVDVERLAAQIEDRKFYDRRGLKAGIFFDRETFGADSLAVGFGSLPLEQVLAAAPLSELAKHQIAQIESESIDHLPGLSSAEKKQRLSRISYETFLRDLVHADADVLKFYQSRTKGEWGVGIDAVSALDCWGIGLPGFQGLQLEAGSIARMGYTPAGYADTGGSARLHFPDGNATIARLLVRNLIPGAVPGHDVADVVTARVDYGALDRPCNATRLRLSSIVVRARHLGRPAPGTPVEITYVRDGRSHTVKARRVVLAGYNMMIPYLCPELPEAQKAALHELVKTPLLYTTVALRDWRAFDALQVHRIHAPGSYHSNVRLNPRVDIGDYHSAAAPDQPILLHMVRTPCHAGLPEHEQNRAGRAELLATSFEDYERHIRAQLQRMLGAGGFEAARDITGITINRWAHGYAPEYNPLFDPELPESRQPHVLGRARFGNIAIANSDSGRAAYTDSAIQQAHRAIAELLNSTPS